MSDDQTKGFLNNIFASAVWDGLKQLWSPLVLAAIVAVWQKIIYPRGLDAPQESKSRKVVRASPRVVNYLLPMAYGRRSTGCPILDRYRFLGRRADASVSLRMVTLLFSVPGGQDEAIRANPPDIQLVRSGRPTQRQRQICLNSHFSARISRSNSLICNSLSRIGNNST